MSARVDLLLVNPGGRLSIYQDLAKALTAIEPPVWCGLMASFIRGKGFSVGLLDANAFDLAPEEVAERVRDVNPRLVAVVVYGHQPSASTQVMPAAGAICTALDATCPEIPVALVGGHVAALPERTLREEAVDFVCTGEGPYSLLDLVTAVTEGARDFHKVRGVCYHDGGKLVRTPSAPLVNDLDAEMPGIAWDLLPMDRYRAHNWECFGGIDRQPYAAIYTTLGCPYKCSFCCIQAPFKEGEALAGRPASVNTYRRWSSDAVLREIDTLVRDYGVTNFKFADEMFVLHKGHVEAICDGLIERDYGLNIWAYARVDTVHAGMTPKLKRAGFNWLALGIEAANAEVRNEVDKGYAQEDIQACLERTAAEDIFVIGNYIFGLPEDTHDTMQQTLDLALDLNCEFANFYCAMAYPGSALYRQAEREGWELPDTWGGYSQHAVNSKPLPTKHLSASEVLRFRDDAFHSYFSNPAYLDKIERMFGAGTVEHIRGMESHRLERAHV